jgi:hypothetical protein
MKHEGKMKNVNSFPNPCAARSTRARGTLKSITYKI